MKFLERGVEINGINVPKNKVKFILNKIQTNHISEKEIKILAKIPQIRFDVLQLSEITIRGLDVPIKISYIDLDNYNLTVLEKSKAVTWDYLKSLFYPYNSRNIIYGFNDNGFLRLIDNMEIKRQDAFDFLKRKAMIKKLKESNKE